MSKVVDTLTRNGIFSAIIMTPSEHLLFSTKYPPFPHPMLYDCSKRLPERDYNIDRGKGGSLMRGEGCNETVLQEIGL